MDAVISFEVLLLTLHFFVDTVIGQNPNTFNFDTHFIKQKKYMIDLKFLNKMYRIGGVQLTQEFINVLDSK